MAPEFSNDSDVPLKPNVSVSDCDYLQMQFLIYYQYFRMMRMMITIPKIRVKRKKARNAKLNAVMKRDVRKRNAKRTNLKRIAISSNMTMMQNTQQHRHHQNVDVNVVMPKKP